MLKWIDQGGQKRHEVSHRTDGMHESKGGKRDQKTKQTTQGTGKARNPSKQANAWIALAHSFCLFTLFISLKFIFLY
jgi:hypothetical protein